MQQITGFDKVRDQIITAVKKTAEGVVISYGIPADRMPILTVSPSEITPVTANQPLPSACAKSLR